MSDWRMLQPVPLRFANVLSLLGRAMLWLLVDALFLAIKIPGTGNREAVKDSLSE